MRLGSGLYLSLVCVAGASAQDIPRNCDLDLQNKRGATTIKEDPSGNRTTIFSGGLVAHCIGQGNTLTADSAEYYQADGRLFLIGNVHYTEPRATVTSRTMTYYQNDDHLHAEGDVVAVTSNGSTLRGPVAEYYRRTPQRPLARLFAAQRPTVTLIQKDTSGRGRPPDTANVVANQIDMEGDSLVYASGRVQITRPDLLATGDSAFLDSGKDFARLMREPSVKGVGTHTFTLTGGLIDVYSRNRQVERVVATPNGHALSQDLELVADSIDLRVTANRLQRAMAWGKTRAHAISPEREIVADSIDAILPDQRVREVRALRKAYAESNPDSGVVSKQRDWMSGDTIVARFDSIPPTDTSSKPRIRQIVALGNARSFYQMKNSKGPANEPSVNYVRGRVIDIDFEDRKVATVTVIDKATGVMVEPVAQAAPTKPNTPATTPRAAPAPAKTNTPTPVKPPPEPRK
ncbi:MAG: LPS export ABC transporter periplasmic protein LptC [Gemmatimonadota bacterium]|nr:LPS export ABC transporter periplasmic protein LptC [Gemmatimonadota bacterium]